MGNITFLDEHGEESLTADMSMDDTVMEVGRREGVRGIIAECGGVMSCGTCHVWLEPDVNEKFEPKEDVEDEVLAELHGYCENSRLGCQLYLVEDADVVVQVPERL
ncbi:2Fe-2S iron-sulfur cluster-binding protein [Microbacterium sp. NC79]|uniref:2Fe-2S iron-sulfur cluster-binding protein n=1 Tax=Microbacterium sp. NC79 TaxID=2851009 RepID=UPI001C2BBE85|nr:2Fe-2S iron-sulfur cluster-binding protein [Microbacterium sp. NC79]MBV0895752.1 (2Fe-2S)-binding protein [Microbacterium sp. NC79]